MSSLRKIVVVLTLVCAVALLVPAGALAGSGPSAGDQQYIDPLGGSSHSGSGSSGSGSGSSSSSSSTTSTVSSSSTPTATTASATPTATSSATTSTGASDPSTSTLPSTGLDDGAILAVGLSMLGGGMLLRRITRRA